MGGLIPRLLCVGSKGSVRYGKPWVENRVVIIREILCCDQWNHVVSGDNPADIPTRLNCFEALAWDMWLHGPEFLRCEYFVLPRFDVEEKLILSEVIEESKKNCEVVTNVVGIGDEVLISNVKKDLGLRNIINAGRYSSLKKLITITGYVLRFVNNLLNKMKKNHEQVSTEEELTVNEFNYAYNLWIKDEQAQLSEQSNYAKRRCVNPPTTDHLPPTTDHRPICTDHRPPTSNIIYRPEKKNFRYNLQPRKILKK